jgi:hypothetical protein
MEKNNTNYPNPEKVFIYHSSRKRNDWIITIAYQFHIENNIKMIKYAACVFHNNKKSKGTHEEKSLYGLEKSENSVSTSTTESKKSIKKNGGEQWNKKQCTSTAIARLNLRPLYTQYNWESMFNTRLHKNQKSEKSHKTVELQDQFIKLRQELVNLINDEKNIVNNVESLRKKAIELERLVTREGPQDSEYKNMITHLRNEIAKNGIKGTYEHGMGIMLRRYVKESRNEKVKDSPTMESLPKVLKTGTKCAVSRIPTFQAVDQMFNNRMSTRL